MSGDSLQPCSTILVQTNRGKYTGSNSLLCIVCLASFSHVDTLYTRLFIVHCSLFTVHRSLFIVHCSLFIVHRSPFIVHSSLFLVHWGGEILQICDQSYFS
ncbi:hypothetical protein M6B38_112680 [Iris pallida]|uniref:Uncharacterized protein n=1 Tax=Iris pallida TaxID=29817 RepID=A0AAX6DMU6_IRIPA|nr:hypothetical protein M6B38_112680 [Iris pallida]